MGKTTLEKKNSFNYQKSEVEADKIADSFSGVSDVKKSMESRFGVDFSGVKLHTDMGAAKKADDIGAAAFAKGSDIYFGKGVYDQGSSLGRHVIAHELAHTMQQGTAGGEGAVSASAPAGEVQMFEMPNFLKKLFGGKKKEEAAPASAPAHAYGNYSRQEIGSGLLEGMKRKDKNGEYRNPNLQIGEGRNIHEKALFATNAREKHSGFVPMVSTMRKAMDHRVDSAMGAGGFLNGKNKKYNDGNTFEVLRKKGGADLVKNFQNTMMDVIGDTLQSGDMSDVIGAQSDAFDAAQGTDVGEYYRNPYQRSNFALRNIGLKGAMAEAGDMGRETPHMKKLTGIATVNMNVMLSDFADLVKDAAPGSLTPDGISDDDVERVMGSLRSTQRDKASREQGISFNSQGELASEPEMGGDPTTPEMIKKFYGIMINLGNQIGAPGAGAPTVAVAPAPTVAPAPVPTVAPAPAAAASAPAKQGFFSKLFGRKKKEETRSPDPVFTGSWTKQESEATRLQQQPLAAMRLQQQLPAATQSQQQSPEVMKTIDDLRARIGVANMSGKTEEVEALMQQIRAIKG